MPLNIKKTVSLKEEPDKIRCCYCGRRVPLNGLLLIGQDKNGNPKYRCRNHKSCVILRGEKRKKQEFDTPGGDYERSC